MNLRIFPLALLLVVILQPATEAQKSENFVLDGVSVGAGSTKSTSANFENTVVAGEVSPGGAASFCNSGFVMSLGFWSALGDIPVSIQLMARQNEMDPGSVDLSWTGAADNFQVYRAFTPEDIFDPANLYAESATCDSVDGSASQSDIIFYKVVPTP